MTDTEPPVTPVTNAQPADIPVTDTQPLDTPDSIGELAEALTVAYRLGWKIISKKFIIESRNTNTLPSICDYELDLANIRTAPADNVLHSKVMTNSTMINNHHVVGGHRELKKNYVKIQRGKNQTVQFRKRAFLKNHVLPMLCFQKMSGNLL